MKKVIIVGGLVALLAAIALIVPWPATESAADDVPFEADTSHVTAQPEVAVQHEGFEEISRPTPNFDPDKRNAVKGVILHHTAEPTVERSLEILTGHERCVGTHCVIDTDGTRYILCEPEVVTYHAGWSVLNGEEGCNNFTIGIEFQGNTLELPLTEEQIYSAIEYLRPIMAKYQIPVSNVVTHEMVRAAYKQKYPKKRCSGKVDITPTEYKRFMEVLEKEL